MNIHMSFKSAVFLNEAKSFSGSFPTLKYSTRSLQVTLDPLISFSTKFSGASSNGTRFRSSRLKSSSISSRHEIKVNMLVKKKEN